jgi:hypothetical protein
MIAKIRWTGHVAYMDKVILVGNREGNTPLGILRRRFEDNIKIDL